MEDYLYERYGVDDPPRNVFGHLIGTPTAPCKTEAPYKVEPGPFASRSVTNQASWGGEPWNFTPDAPATVNPITAAINVTSKDRNTGSKSPEDNFEKIAAVWTGMLLEKLKPECEIIPGDVARMMIGLKLCRDMHGKAYDNRVDIHGYTICLERLEHTA